MSFEDIAKKIDSCLHLQDVGDAYKLNMIEEIVSTNNYKLIKKDVAYSDNIEYLLHNLLQDKAEYIRVSYQTPLIEVYKQIVKKIIPYTSKWRLPTVNELITLIDYEHTTKSILNDSKITSPYWTATSHLSKKYTINFNNGTILLKNKSDKCFCRFVRKDTKELKWSKSSSEAYTYEEAIKLAQDEKLSDL